MNRYFMKKYIYAVLFLIIMLTGSAASALGMCGSLSGETGWCNFEKEAGKTFPIQNQLRELTGWFYRLQGKEVYGNLLYVKDKKGSIYSTGVYREDDPMLMEYAKRMRRLKEEAAKKSTRVFFISMPGKNSPGKIEFSEGIPAADINPVQDEFLLYLQNNHVDALDMRMVLAASGIPYEKQFYKTDYVWTTQSAFAAFCAIVEMLETRYDEVLDPMGVYCAPESYNQREFPQSMLGSMGRTAGKAFSGLDDFTLITPRFQLDLCWESLRGDGRIMRQEGGFEQALLFEERFEDTDVGGYDAYLNRQRAWDRIINRENPDGPKILCIRDAYFAPVACFLSIVSSEIHLISPFVPNAETVDVQKYIEENRFDYIMVAVGPDKINDTAFSFYTHP